MTNGLGQQQWLPTAATAAPDTHRRCRPPRRTPSERAVDGHLDVAEGVDPGPAVSDVEPGVAGQFVHSSLAEQEIIVRAAEDLVPFGATEDLVLPATALDHVPAAGSGRGRPRLVVAVDAVGPGVAGDVVVPAAAFGIVEVTWAQVGVVPGVAEHRVHPVAGVDGVRVDAAADNVVAGSGRDDVIPPFPTTQSGVASRSPRTSGSEVPLWMSYPRSAASVSEKPLQVAADKSTEVNAKHTGNIESNVCFMIVSYVTFKG